MQIKNKNIYETKNGLKVLIQSEEAVCSPMPWDFTGRDLSLGEYLHFRSNGTCYEGEEYNLKMKEDNKND